jgi:hypothetical protein
MDDPTKQPHLVVLALFGQLERTYAAERSAHARAVAATRGRCAGRIFAVDADEIEHVQLRRN